MFNWINNAVSNMVSWVGNGTARLIEWLLGGLADMFGLIFDAGDSIFSVFERMWDLGAEFVDTIFGLFSALFPFIPEPVSAAVSAALIVTLILGVVRKVRGK